VVVKVIFYSARGMDRWVSIFSEGIIMHLINVIYEMYNNFCLCKCVLCSAMLCCPSQPVF
jgi:hypothetical protein